ncbi:MAG TPA: hypothetical protein VLD18_12975, partial [Verrucomicrobiae bacterium]|nr:hypothetical protein [Verrucomicrobiae bacterium]
MKPKTNWSSQWIVSRCLIGLTVAAAPLGAQEFIPVSAALEAMSYSAATWGDYDNDLDLDVLLVGHNTSQ